jgi:hypothetical protein
LKALAVFLPASPGRILFLDISAKPRVDGRFCGASKDLDLA